MGDAINLAARMEQHAPVGGILITQDTYRHVRGVFDVRAQEPLWVQGRSEPVRTYLVERAKPRAFRMETRGVEGIETRLVGRELELSALQHTYQEVLAEAEPRVVTVVGEAGVGKSRLLDEFLGWVELQPERTWYFKGRAVPGTQGAPYGLWRDLFAYRFGILESDSAATVQDKLRQGMAEYVEQTRAEVLGHLVGFDLSGSATVASALHRGGFAEAATGYLVAYFRELLAQGDAAVIVLEDLQWADDSSLDLVARLVGEVEAGRLLVAGAARSVLYDRRPNWGEGLSAYTRLDLRPLTKRASRKLVEQVLRRVRELPQGLRDLVVEGAEGNPFYVEELIKILIEDEVIDRGDGVWTVSLERLAEVRVPPTLTAVLQARLDALTPEEKVVLQRASVVGREFWDQVVADMAADLAEQREVTARLGALRGRELVYRHERSAFADAEEYAFRHSVLRDVTYETVLLSARRRYHRHVARWLEGHAGERLAEYLGVIAAHYELAGEGERALDYLLRAGDRARGLGAFREAIGYYERAAALLRKGNDADRTARTLMTLGLTYHNAFQFERARAAYEEGFSLWQRAAERQESILEPAPSAFRAHAFLFPAVSLDPAHAPDTVSAAMITQLFSGLVSFDRAWNVVPDVARTWEVSDGGRRYVFHLRDDVTWSDGVPVTAADFAFAWMRMLDPATESPGAPYLYDLKGARDYHASRVADPGHVGVTALDERTLVVELARPTGYFLQLLAVAGAGPVPRHRVRALAQAWADPERIVTNGPFVLAGCEEGASVTLERDPSYHGRFEGNVRQVVLSIGDPAASLPLYEAGRLDLVALKGMTAVEVDRARQRYPDQYLSAPELSIYALAFDVTRPPFDNPRVRRALALTIDREWLASVALKGSLFPATGGMVPPGMPGHSAGIGLPYDPEQAARLLAEDGYRSGRGFPPVECLMVRGRIAVHSGNALSAAWREHLGLQLNWTELPWGDLLDRLETAPPHLWIAGWAADYPDPDNFLRVATWRRQTGWQNCAYYDLLAAAERCSDPKRRIEMYQQADRILVEEAPVVPLAYGRAHYLVKPWVRFVPQATGLPRWQDCVVEPH
jgi:ABC-type oligopeptide transport system substrate-binding subunit